MIEQHEEWIEMSEIIMKEKITTLLIHYILKVVCVGSGGEELEFEHLGRTEYYCVTNHLFEKKYQERRWRRADP